MDGNDTQSLKTAFEADFKNAVRSDVQKSILIQSSTKSSKAPLVAGIILATIFTAIGITFLVNPSISDTLISMQNDKKIQSLQNEIDKLRKQENEILYEEGFSEQYYAALEKTSQVIEKQQDIQNSPNSNSSLIIIIAVILFVLAIISFTVGLILFIKL